ncbi:hypothetical protein [Frankia sp. Cas4]|uniref:hypothetical protein n=1 Tax=Frankia sp. Cas4 TaxID=3073927 RepID=UPI002AD35C37|nr:hypothetical protein [Frankia sp. Cas4]
MYSHVRFVFYETDTHQQYRPSCLPKPVDFGTEARIRAQYLLEVARFIAKKIADDPVTVNGTVLNVFLAPEFYFRSSQGQQSGHNHYGHFDVQQAQNSIKDAVRGDSLFNDWLLVPGTAVYSKKTFDSQGSFKYVIFSEAYAVARVSAQVTTGNQLFHWTCMKQDFSDVDHLDNDVNAMSTGKTSAQHAHRQIISVGGLEIGIEICLDHRSEVLKTTAVAQQPARNVDIQLLPACGMDAIPTSVAARTGGYVLRCNGNNYQPPRGKAYQVGAWPNGHPTAGTAPILTEIDTGILVYTLPSTLQINPSPWIPDRVGYLRPQPL